MNRAFSSAHDPIELGGSPFNQVQAVPSNIMVKYLAMMMTVSSIFLIKEGSEESLTKRAELWHYLKDASKGMFRLVNHQVLSRPMQIRGKAGRKMLVWAYSISRKIYGFN